MISNKIEYQYSYLFLLYNNIQYLQQIISNKLKLLKKYLRLKMRSKPHSQRTIFKSIMKSKVSIFMYLKWYPMVFKFLIYQKIQVLVQARKQNDLFYLFCTIFIELFNYYYRSKNFLEKHILSKIKINYKSNYTKIQNSLYSRSILIVFYHFYLFWIWRLNNRRIVLLYIRLILAGLLLMRI